MSSLFMRKNHVWLFIKSLYWNWLKKTWKNSVSIPFLATCFSIALDTCHLHYYTKELQKSQKRRSGITQFIKKYVLSNFLSFLFCLSAGVCLLLTIVFAINTSLLTNDSPLPTWLIFLIAAVCYFFLAILISVIKTRKKK